MIIGFWKNLFFNKLTRSTWLIWIRINLSLRVMQNDIGKISVRTLIRIQLIAWKHPKTIAYVLFFFIYFLKYPGRYVRKHSHLLIQSYKPPAFIQWKRKRNTHDLLFWLKVLNYCNSSLLLSCRPKNIVTSYSCIHRIKMFKCSQPDRLRQPFLFSGAMSKLSWAVGAECINMFKTKELHSQNVHILHLPLVLQDLEDPNYML